MSDVYCTISSVDVAPHLIRTHHCGPHFETWASPSNMTTIAYFVRFFSVEAGGRDDSSETNTD